MKDIGTHVSSLAAANRTDPRTSSLDTLMHIPRIPSQESEMGSMHGEVLVVQDNSEIIHTGQSAVQVRPSGAKGNGNDYGVRKSLI